MREEWQKLSLPDCLEKGPKSAKIPKKAFLSSGAFPIVSQEKNLVNGYWDNQNDAILIDRPVVVFGDHTQILKLVDFDFVVGADGVKILKPKTFLDAKYLYYFLLGHPLKTLGYARHYRLLKELNIEFPSHSEQKRIVAILDEAFAGIDAAIANTEKNLANSRELFESYLNSVFSQTSPDWTQTTIGHLVEEAIIEKPKDGNHGEIHPKKTDFVLSGTPFIMACDLVDGYVNQSDCHFITRMQADSLRKGFALNGDVLLSHKGTIGRSAILETNFDYLMLTPQVTYYRVVNSEVLTNKFLFYAFHSPLFLREMKRIAGAGSTRAYIGITKQLELPVAFPSCEAQERYADIFDDLSKESRRLGRLYQDKLVALKELKQSLLQKAFTGELTAENMENEAREAVI